jgi:nucleoprotein TPR
LELAKAEADRATADLSTKSEQFNKDRRTLRAELSQLQTQHELLIQKHAATESRLQTLQHTHTTQSQQLVHAQTMVQDLRGRIAEQEATYTGEVSNLKRLVQMMEDRENEARAIVEGIESEWASVGDRAERRELALRDELEKERHRTEVAEHRIEEMERVLERVNRGDFPLPRTGSTPSTPARNSTPDLMSQGMLGLSPTVAMASKAQRSGKTFTEVYTDFVRLQEEYARKCVEYDRMDRTLAEVLAQIEERVSIIFDESTLIFVANNGLLGTYSSATTCRIRAFAIRSNTTGGTII